MHRARQALTRHARKLLGLDNVVGVGFGLKETEGEVREEPSLTVLVKKKLPRTELKRYEIIPETLEGTLTDVIEVGELELLGRTDRQRPAQPGVSMGHYRISAGTFGAVVYDARTRDPLVLSNNHVLANSSDGRDGRARKGDPILQPGRYDGGTSRDIIAQLERFVPLYRESSPTRCMVQKAVLGLINALLGITRSGYELRLHRRSYKDNTVDAAVAKPLSPNDISSEVLEIGIPNGIAGAELGMKVHKSGRSSGVTVGTVRVVDAVVRVSMGEIGTAVFKEQVVTTPMARPGDSGSLVMTEDRLAVGLLSAGSEQATIFGKIENVLDQLRITL